MHPGRGELSPATTPTPQIANQLAGTEANSSLGQHTAKSNMLPAAPAAAAALGKGFRLEGWITPVFPQAALIFPYRSLVPCSSILAWPLAPGIGCS